MISDTTTQMRQLKHFNHIYVRMAFKSYVIMHFRLCSPNLATIFKQADVIVKNFHSQEKPLYWVKYLVTEKF